jgi:hypothetical protein
VLGVLGAVSGRTLSTKESQRHVDCKIYLITVDRYMCKLISVFFLSVIYSLRLLSDDCE